jgi:predicted TIM-barrel fold metal-dependent hydrolase
MNVIDGDSHFMEPLDLYVRYIDPAFRDRAMRIENDAASGEATILVDGRPLKLINATDLLAAVVAYGQKEAGQDVSHFDSQVIYPTLGLLWEGSVEDPVFADALCRAYNSWVFELCAGHADRLFPAAHISLRDADLAVRELKRVAKLGCRTIFVAAAPVNGHSFGHPDLDPIWAAVQDLDLSVGIHLTGHRHSTGRQWYRDRDPGMMFVTMNLIQDPRMALTTMVYDGVLERFPRLRVGTIEAMVGWIGEWLERLDYRYKYMGHTSQMKRSASEYFERNIWINGDPEEQMFPLIVQFAGDEKFFVGSDYPHAEGFVEPVKKARETLSSLSEASINKILGENASRFFGI